MKPLTKFLFDLSSDKDLRERMELNPYATMEDSGLTKDQQELILKKDSEKLSKAIAEENDINLEKSTAIEILILITIRF